MSFKELGNGLEETSASISDASVANLVRWHMNMLSGKDKKPDLPGRAWGWARPPSSRRFHCRSDENPAPGRRGAAGGLARLASGRIPWPTPLRRKSPCMRAWWASLWRKGAFPSG